MAIITPLSLETTINEQYGEVVSAISVATVTKVQGTTATDKLVAALATYGVPQPGEILHGDWFPDVRVEDRSARIVGQDGTGATVRIDIAYRQQRSVARTPLSGGASLGQVTTQVDRNNSPIEVTHNGDTVRAELSVLDPQRHVVRELVLSTDDPDGEVNKYIGKVNADFFLSGQGATWLCADVRYDLVDRVSTPARYKFTFEFLYKSTGHVYTAVYKDPQGNIPAGVIEGEGIKDIYWHQPAVFGELFS